MKLSNLQSIIFTFMFLPFFMFSQEATDIKEYGFKGQVKSVSATYYKGVLYANGKFIFTYKKAYLKKIKFFDKKGNFDKVISYLLDEDNNWKISTIDSFAFKNGKKKAFYTTDGTGVKINKAEVDWLAKYSYRITQRGLDEKKIVFTSFLNKKFRDSAGVYQVYTNSYLRKSGWYRNIFDKNGNVLGVVLQGYGNDNETTLSYKLLKKDTRGNLIKFASVNKETGVVRDYVERTFTYYD